ncbi:hypothetical protein [Luteimicrobium sp. DT211]|uniref:hypothetical protein n=1 Tax=Luteimicrobium sp. DT211 TaxID=3393412 RepID=UPI003CF54B38
MSPEQPVSPGAPSPDDAPSPASSLTSAPLPGLVQVAGPAAGDTPIMLVAGASGMDDAGLCIDGVCALPGAAPDAT